MIKLTLHPVKRATRASNRYCGPSILSALSGLDTKDTATLLRSVSGKRAIKGTSTTTLKAALSKLGFETAYFPTNFGTCTQADLVRGPIPYLTFVRWAKLSRERRGSEAILLVMGNHWAVVKGHRYVCGLTKKPVPFSQVPHRCARVTEAYRLLRLAAPRPASVIAAIPQVANKNAFPSQTADRLAVKRLAEPYAIDVDDSQRDKDDPDGNIWVYPGDQWPEGLTDPFDDEHFHCDWESARKAVETYIAALQSAQPMAAQISA